MHQPQQKAHKKREREREREREIKQRETESLNFILKSIFEDSDPGSDNSDVELD